MWSLVVEDVENRGVQIAGSKGDIVGQDNDLAVLAFFGQALGDNFPVQVIQRGNHIVARIGSAAKSQTPENGMCDGRTLIA